MPLDPKSHTGADSGHTLSDVAKFGEMPSQKNKMTQREFINWASPKLHVDACYLKTAAEVYCFTCFTFQWINFKTWKSHIFIKVVFQTLN